MEKNFKTVSKLLFPEETALNQTPSQRFENMLRKQYLNLQRERLKKLKPNLAPQVEQEQKYKEIADFMKEHIISVGKKQAIKDFQAGINFLHIDVKDFIKEDGNFGEKTFKAFYEICKFYGLDVIKEAIRKGAVSNAVLDTTENPNVNTDFLVDNINKNLNTNKEVM